MSFLERFLAFFRALFSARVPAPTVPAPATSTRLPTAPARATASSKLGLSPDELVAKYASTRSSSATPTPKPAEPVPLPGPAPARKPVAAPAPARSLESIFDEVGSRVGVDPNLLRAIATVESSYGRQLHSAGSPSYGVMQINCGSLPGPNDPCTRKLPAGFMREWPVTPQRLTTDHAYNVELGARLYKDGLRSLRGDVVRAIAAYNVGSPAIPRTGPIPERLGAERPREYARKVLTEWKRRGGPDLLADEALR